MFPFTFNLFSLKQEESKMLTNAMYGKENTYLRVKAKKTVQERTKRLPENLRNGTLIGNKIIWEDGVEETYVYRGIQNKH
jgi:hypothetical protein